MVPNHTLTHSHLPSLLPTSHFSSQIHPISIKHVKLSNLNPKKRPPFLKSSYKSVKCSVSVVSEPTHKGFVKKPSPAEVCRTIMELSSLGTLSTLTQEGWPLGIGVRFAVDNDGTPVLCLNASNRHFSADRRNSSLHVQSRSTQCTLQGSLDKPEDRTVLKKLHSTWNERFGEEVDEDLIYIVSVERVLQIEDFKEDGVWVTSSDYKNANPDPLRDFAEKIVNDINTNHAQDFERICDIYVDLGFQVTDAKLTWVDRLGFDVHIISPQKETYEVRIPFPREVTDEKGVKSSFNCMSQLAWEVEKNYSLPDFEKGGHLKQIR
ncbi:hypothetical protein GIB67_018667 [Kingdonia uniflora]|uniref:DUF2470 domain-containing protein n=1 Tax=Kingdonia uniflora TaxID=39325 RepID=A0A7J7M2J0_9MAGN|nr:hypothetical protein GIB67_018667 [Kingdonia uniflora]